MADRVFHIIDNHGWEDATPGPCRRCGLVLPSDLYPRGDEVRDEYRGWCTQCIRDDQAREHGLAAAILRDRATLRRTLALAIDDRVVTE